MRRYPANSPRAAARVVALILLADGSISRGELDALLRAGLYERLGVEPADMQVLLEDLARDLFEFGGPAWDHAGGLHPLAVRCVLDDVTEPRLRQEVLEICGTVADADRHITDGEHAVLALAGAHWQLPVPLPATA